MTNKFLMVGLVFTALACNTNMNDVLSSTDIAALQIMETSYTAAVEANNSLATYVESTGIINDETCFTYDSIFHQNDSIFEASHMMYSHTNSGDDHSSGDWSMGSGMSGFGNGGMMSGDHSGGRFSTQSCSQSNLNLMDSLMVAHEQYHPNE